MTFSLSSPHVSYRTHNTHLPLYMPFFYMNSLPQKLYCIVSVCVSHAKVIVFLLVCDLTIVVKTVRTVIRLGFPYLFIVVAEVLLIGHHRIFLDNVKKN